MKRLHPIIPCLTVALIAALPTALRAEQNIAGREILAKNLPDYLYGKWMPIECHKTSPHLYVKGMEIQISGKKWQVRGVHPEKNGAVQAILAHTDGPFRVGDAEFRLNKQNGTLSINGIVDGKFRRHCS